MKRIDEYFELIFEAADVEKNRYRSESEILELISKYEDKNYLNGYHWIFEFPTSKDIQVFRIKMMSIESLISQRESEGKLSKLMKIKLQQTLDELRLIEWALELNQEKDVLGLKAIESIKLKGLAYVLKCFYEERIFKRGELSTDNYYNKQRTIIKTVDRVGSPRTLKSANNKINAFEAVIQLLEGEGKKKAESDLSTLISNVAKEHPNFSISKASK